MKTCGQCKHFTGAGDWNLCCTQKHPVPKMGQRSKDLLFGHLCYEYTKACDLFEEKI